MQEKDEGAGEEKQKGLSFPARFLKELHCQKFFYFLALFEQNTAAVVVVVKVIPFLQNSEKLGFQGLPDRGFSYVDV